MSCSEMRSQRAGRRPPKRPAMSNQSRIDTGSTQTTEATDKYLITEKLLDIPHTPLIIPGFGGVSFPVYAQSANYLKQPIRHGFIGQRRLECYELRGTEFKIENPNWANYLNEVVLPKVAEGLKVDYCHLEAKLVKFLLYERGSFVDNHADSSKELGSFGTLIIQLPSKYTGGQFVATLDGTTRVIDHSSSVTGSTNEFSGFLTAFSLGVEHRVKVVTEGYRSCLTYDLIDTRLKPPVEIHTESESDDLYN